MGWKPEGGWPAERRPFYIMRRLHLVLHHPRIRGPAGVRIGSWEPAMETWRGEHERQVRFCCRADAEAWVADRPGLYEYVIEEETP